MTRRYDKTSPPISRFGAALGRRAFLCLALFFACVSSRSPAFAATHLIAVGNNQGRSDEPHLRFAERDAQDLSNVLRRLGRVTAENTRLLLGEDADAFRRVILNANVRLRSNASGAEGDVLVIYYSGHADATGLHLGSSELRFDELRALVEGSPAQIRLLIIDSCQSGGITQIKGANPTTPFSIQLDQRLEAEGLAIITSSAGTEDSQESESLRASFFTHHFVTGLRGAADIDHDGRVTLNEAYGYAYRGTLHSSGRTTRLQHPTYSYALKGKGDLVLTYLGAESTQYGRLYVPVTGSYLVLEGNESGSAVAELFVENEGARVLLPPGRYFVRRRADTSYREYAIELVSGGEVDLSRERYDEITYSRLLRKGGGTRQSFHSVSLVASAGAAIASGYGLNKSLSGGYAIDFPWITLGTELRLGLASAESHGLNGLERELAARIRAERFLDLDWVSLALGVFVEGVNMHQSFETAGEAPTRNAWSVGFGSLLALERPLLGGFALRFEGGLVTHIIRVAHLEDGAAVSESLETPLNGYFGIGGRFSL